MCRLQVRADAIQPWQQILLVFLPLLKSSFQTRIFPCHASSCLPSCDFTQVWMYSACLPVRPLGSPSIVGHAPWHGPQLYKAACLPEIKPHNTGIVVSKVCHVLCLFQIPCTCFLKCAPGILHAVCIFLFYSQSLNLVRYLKPAIGCKELPLQCQRPVPVQTPEHPKVVAQIKRAIRTFKHPSSDGRFCTVIATRVIQN